MPRHYEAYAWRPNFWVLSETIISYTIILTRFGGNFVTSFSRQKCQNLKNKKHTILGNGEFYIVGNFQVNCVKTKNDEWRWAFLDVFNMLPVLNLFQLEDCAQWAPHSWFIREGGVCKVYCRHECEKGEERTVKILQNLAKFLCKVRPENENLFKIYVVWIFIQWKKSVFSF